jgi:beta-1,4-mannosyltransferase
MLNHAWILAENGASVSLAGYRDSEIDRTVAEHPGIRIHAVRSLARPREGVARLMFLASSFVRVTFLALESLWLLLVRTPRADVVLVQNPPAFPTLLAAWLAARTRRSAFVIDWHNFGYAMLSPRLGSNHVAVRIARWLERRLARNADVHLCVSSAMREVLVNEFQLPSPVVLPDKPRELSPLVPISERSAVARQVLHRAGLAFPENAALALCPTSWSADEDMNLLLESLRLWDAQAAEPTPSLFVLITGLGPLREDFESRVSPLSWKRVILRTAFLDPAGYRELLSAAHFGLCLHRSTSGVDLPMKLMDLFGARTPACVLDYGECLNEQIRPGATALTFRNSHELADRIDELLRGFPDNPRLLERMQHEIDASCTETWREVWLREAAPVLRRALQAG